MVIVTDNRFYRDETFKHRITKSDNLIKILNDKIKIKNVKKLVSYLRKENKKQNGKYNQLG